MGRAGCSQSVRGVHWERARAVGLCRGRLPWGREGATPGAPPAPMPGLLSPCLGLCCHAASESRVLSVHLLLLRVVAVLGFSLNEGSPETQLRRDHREA